LWVSLNTGSGLAPKEKWYSGSHASQNNLLWADSASNHLSTFLDLNGDGLPDRVDHCDYATSSYGLWVSFNKGTGFNQHATVTRHPEVVTSVTDGFGSRLEAEYRRINDPTPVAPSSLPVYS